MSVSCPPKTKLRSLSLGLLNEEESGELIRHLDKCDVCQTEIQSVDSFDDTLVNGLAITPVESWIDGYENEEEYQVASIRALAALGCDLEPATQRIPSQLGEYEIIRPLARGGMGQVYLGKHTKLDRNVAIKVIADHRIMDQVVHDRFAAEMKNIGSLSHPNIVQAFDAREIDGIAVLVTEYIDGLNANELLKRNSTISVANACAIVSEICKALEYVDKKGLIHRDVKPSNIMVDKDGQVRLLDLGLARLQANHSEKEFTATGQAIGTVDYVAPEQINEATAIDLRTDIYSLGCTFYKLLSGQPPFPNPRYSTQLEKLNAHVFETPELVEVTDESTPLVLQKLLQRMLEKDPSDRPAAFDEVKAVVDPFAKNADLKHLVIESQHLAELSDCEPNKPLSKSTKEHQTWPKVAVLVATLAGMLFGLWLGIIVSIKKPDGTSASVEIPDGSSAVIDSDGNIMVELGKDQSFRIDAENVKKPDAATQLVEFESEQPILLRARKGDLVDVIAMPELIDGKLIRRKLIATKKELGAIEVSWSGEKDLMGQPMGVAKVKFELDEEERLAVEQARGAGQEIAVVSHSDETGVSANLAKFQGAWRGISKKEKGGSLRLFDQGPLVVNNDSFVWADMGIGSARLQGFAAANTAVLVLDKPVDGISVLYMPFMFTGKNELEIAIAEQPSADLESSFLTIRLERITAPQDKREELVLEALDSLDTADMKCTFHLAKVPKNGEAPEDLQLVEVREFGYPENPRKLWMQPEPLFTNRDFVFANVSEFGEGSVSIKLSEEASDRWNAKLSQFGVRDVHYVVKLDGKVFTSSSSFFDSSVKYSFYRHTSIFVGGDLDKQQEIAARIIPKLNIKDVEDELERISENADNLRWISRAFLFYEAQVFRLPASRNQKKGSKPYSWRVALLPSLGYQKLFDEYRFNEDWDSKHNKQLLSKMPSCFRAKDAPKDSTTTSYVAIVTDHSAIGLEQGVTLGQMSDGTSNTLLIVETETDIPWTKPEDFSLSEKVVEKLRDAASTGLRAVTVDGTIRVLSKANINEMQLEIVTNREDGKVITDW